jgi:RimJ/RimL family protein N-acetyltransferase
MHRVFAQGDDRNTAVQNLFRRRGLLRYCFQDLGVRRIAANCFLDNDPPGDSWSASGMRRELHAIRESLHRSGRWLDTVGYAILEEEWSPS